MPEERRVVTVLFADVTGSTALGEASDPEDVRALLGRYYAIAREVVGAHGGTLEKFIGDAVMAVFGIPVAHGDDAERALSAALALREAVAADPQTAALVLRMGVNSGEVVATRETAGGDFLVTGDAVNVAARLQQHAEPGAILVGQRTCRATSAFRFADEQRIAVKGKQEPIVGAVLLERAARRVARTQFLGREHDLAQLDLVAWRAFTEKRPQLVTITAPAGTGKSRLVDEFVSKLGPDVRVATAQCLPYGAAVTFLPLRGLVRGLLRVDDAAIQERLRDAFTGAGFSGDDAQRLTGLIGATLGESDTSERHDRDEVFAAWRVLIETLAARGPLVVVFEDLHWASDTLLDLVEHVTVSRTHAPLVMIALARPELLDRRSHWGGGRRAFTSLALEPLTEEQTRRLVTILTEGVPGQIADRIVERAGGNPFFAGELVRAYEASRRDGIRDVDIVLPDTVHATVLARIDGLPDPQRRILEYAAVTGRTARASAIAALLPDVSPAAIEDELESLADREFLVAQGTGAYTFRHIVIREVGYATLPRAERVRAHLRLAEWLEGQGTGNDLVELVAYHFRQALALTPGGRVPDGLDAARVVAALERAAAVAASGAAYVEAGQQLREAIRLTPEPEQLRLYERLGDTMQFGDEAIGGYTEAFERWRAVPDAEPLLGARLLIKRLIVATRWAGSITRPMSPEEIAELVRSARSLLAHAPDAVLEAKLTCAEAFEASRATDVDAAAVAELRRRVASACALFASRGDAEAESEALDALAAVHRRAGEFASALAAQEQRLAMADRLGILERIDAAGVALWDLVFLGRYNAAVDMYGRARAVLRPGEPEYMNVHVVSWAAYAAMLCGRWDECLAFADRLMAFREEAPFPMGRFTYPGWTAAIRVASARQDTSRLARYRSAARAVANVEELLPEQRPQWEALIENDARVARETLTVPGSRDRKGEMLALILFDAREPVSEAELVALEGQALADPPPMTMRIALARALAGDDAALRSALSRLDEAEHVADAARAAALLALRTHETADRDDAERRLIALGDRQYLQVLAEEW